MRLRPPCIPRRVGLISQTRSHGHPGAFAMYVGPTRNATRKVLVLAEASGGWMYVEAVGQKGVNVRFSVKRSNLREPELDLFD